MLSFCLRLGSPLGDGSPSLADHRWAASQASWSAPHKWSGLLWVPECFQRATLVSYRRQHQNASWPRALVHLHTPTHLGCPRHTDRDETLSRKQTLTPLMKTPGIWASYLPQGDPFSQVPKTLRKGSHWPSCLYHPYQGIPQPFSAAADSSNTCWLLGLPAFSQHQYLKVETDLKNNQVQMPLSGRRN